MTTLLFINSHFITLPSQASEVLHRNAIDKAIAFITRKLPEEQDPYALAVAACALAEAKNPQASFALQQLNTHVNVTGEKSLLFDLAKTHLPERLLSAEQ